MTVTMVTQIDAESVLYTVHTGDPLLGDFGDSREVWRKEVPFGRGERFRPGGPAFVAAAREQQQIAESYALMPYEPSELEAEAQAATAKSPGEAGCPCGPDVKCPLHAALVSADPPRQQETP